MFGFGQFRSFLALLCLNFGFLDLFFARKRRGKTMQFDDFYVQGRNIRFVQIPDAVNMMEAIEYQLGSIERRRTQHSQERKKMMALREERRRKREAKSKKT